MEGFTLISLHTAWIFYLLFHFISFCFFYNKHVLPVWLGLRPGIPRGGQGRWESHPVCPRGRFQKGRGQGEGGWGWGGVQREGGRKQPVVRSRCVSIFSSSSPLGLGCKRSGPLGEALEGPLWPWSFPLLWGRVCFRVGFLAGLHCPRASEVNDSHPLPSICFCFVFPVGC